MAITSATEVESTSPPTRSRPLPLIILAVSIPMFLVALNNLVVTNALPAIHAAFDASQQDLQWVINVYVLAFAGLLLTGAGLGDRYGRRLVFIAGTVVFAAGSVACALSGSLEALLIGRFVQGVGAAAVMPLSLTLLSAAVPVKMRAAAIGIWSGINGLGIALGPLVGGAVTDGMDWKWVFWVNVPVAIVGVLLAVVGLTESKGTDNRLDLFGMITVAASVTLLVWGIVRGGQVSWTNGWVIGAFVGSAVLMVVFVAWEAKCEAPLLPLRFYKVPTFVLSNIVSLAMYFGVFGAIFFLAQYMQGPMRFDALEAGVRTLPWTAMPMVVAPLAGAFTDRIGGGRLMAAGLAFQAIALAWIAHIVTPDLAYSSLVLPMILGGAGMGLVFAPTTAVVLASVRPEEAGKASGANNTVREVGGALGTAVLTTVFTRYSSHVVVHGPHDGHGMASAFVHGMQAAIWFGVVVVALGAVAGAFIRKPKVSEQ